MGLKRREGFSCLLLPPPAFRECGHSSFARRSVAVRRRAVLMVPEGQRPRPRRSDRRGNIIGIVGRAVGEMLDRERVVSRNELLDGLRDLRIDTTQLETTLCELRATLAQERSALYGLGISLQSRPKPS
jgi:hypothetical protein